MQSCTDADAVMVKTMPWSHAHLALLLTSLRRLAAVGLQLLLFLTSFLLSSASLAIPLHFAPSPTPSP